MKLIVSADPIIRAAARAVVVLPVFAGAAGAEPGPGVSELGLAQLVERSRFAADAGAHLLVGGRDNDPFEAALIVGLGPRGEAGLDTLRRAMSTAIVAVGGFPRVVTPMAQACVSGSDAAEESAAVVEGALAGSYSYSGSRAAAPAAARTEQLTVLVPSEAQRAAAQRAVDVAAVVSSATAWARTLVNRAPNELTPLLLADEARRMGAEYGLQVRVHDVDELRAGGFGGILAVGGGSVNPPCLIEVRHPGTNGRVVGLAGKGITFDSGGLLLKTKQAMADMRSDMAGAATMLAVAQAAARLGCATGVIAVSAAAENMPSGGSYRPGDIIRHRGGLTSEVLDTDAEGRITLADALAYLSEQRPDVLVDAATLTYDVICALGNQIGGILGTDPALVRALVDAGARAGEPLWELPLWAGYRRNIESKVADLRNDGGSYADAIHAALFLGEFTKGIPWAHLDIAGTAFLERDGHDGPAGATGVGVRTLVRWLMLDTAAPAG